MNAAISPQLSSVRRVDVRLRARFPHISTKIFELDRHNHVIFVPEEMLNAATFGKIFSDELRPVTVNVRLTNNPQPGGTEIPCISDDEIARKLEGFHFSRIDLEVAIAALFPTAPEVTFCDNSGVSGFQIGLAAPLSPQLLAEIKDFVSNHVRGLEVSIVVMPPEQTTDFSNRPSSETDINFKPYHHRSGVPLFVKEEEEWYYGSLDKIVERYISPRSFDFVKDAGMSCYIHGTAFPQIDLRQALVAFDTIYLEPPLSESASSGTEPSWSSQSISRQDLLKMIEVDRVRLVHSQPEERGDLGFLREAREVNPRGVVGRRMTAALMLTNIVEIAHEYRLGQTDVQVGVREIIKRLADDLRIPIEEVARSVLYPDHMRRLAVESLTSQGLMGSSTFNLGRMFADTLKRHNEKDVLIESSMFGQCIHTAHALGATYIPHVPHDSYVGTWIAPMQIMGNMLNYYSAMNSRVAAAWAINERSIEERRVVLPPVPLFDFNRHAPIEDILACSSHRSFRRKGRSIISRLAALPEDQRLAEIDVIEREIYEKGITRERRAAQSEMLDAGVSIADFVASWGLYPFTPAWKVLNKMLEVARKSPSVDRFIDVIEADLSSAGNEDIDFLSKVSRVARIRSVV